jgi:tryptophan-rich sensory protein
MTRRELLALFGFLATCYAVAGAGGLLTGEGVTSWYPTITKPTWNPPNTVFGPVWSTLFTAMAVAAWLVWRRTGLEPLAMGLFAAQLALNLAWSGLFFAARRPDLALIDIVLLLVAIALTALVFRRHSSLAAWLLAPYLAWVAFASSLNAAIWWLNR